MNAVEVKVLMRGKQGYTAAAIHCDSSMDTCLSRNISSLNVVIMHCCGVVWCGVVWCAVLCCAVLCCGVV